MARSVLFAVAAVIVSSSGCIVVGLQPGAGEPPPPEDCRCATAGAGVLGETSEPRAVVTYGDAVLSADWANSSLTAYDARTHAVLRTITPPSPSAVNAIERIGSRVYLLRPFGKDILVLDADTFTQVDDLSVEGQGTMCAAPDGSALYFMSSDAPEARIIKPSGEELARIAYPSGSYGAGSCVASADGRFLFLGIQRGAPSSDPRGEPLPAGASFVAQYDLQAGRYLAFFPTGESGSDVSIPWAMLLSPDGHTLYVGMFQSNAGIYLIDVDAQAIRGNLPFPSTHPSFTWADPMALAIRDGRLYVLLRNNGTLAVLDEQTHEALGSPTPLQGDGQGNLGVALTASEIVVSTGALNWVPLAAP